MFLVSYILMTTFKLFWANIKMIVRNKQALFWTLVFPLIFLVIFGLFDMDSFGSSKILVVDEANTETSQKIVSGFKEVENFKIETSTEASRLDEARSRLKKNELDFILVIPPSAKDLPTDFKPEISFNQQTMQPTVVMPKAPDPVKLTVYYNEGNVANNQLVLNMLDQMTSEINAKSSNAPELFKLNKEPLTNKKVRYIDFLMPGILAMSLMQSAIMGIAFYLTEAREKKILKRILATPVDRKSFIVAQVLSRLAVSIAQAVIIITTAKLLYDVNIYGNLGYVAIWVTLGTLVFLMMGFIISSFSRTATAAETLAQIITMPMLFLSGVFFSTETLPALVKKVVDILPLSPIIDALRKIIIDGDTLASTTHQLWIVGGWLAVTFIVALLVFRVARD